MHKRPRLHAFLPHAPYPQPCFGLSPQTCVCVDLRYATTEVVVMTAGEGEGEALEAGADGEPARKQQRRGTATV
jgi:hypothetical protein